MRKQIHLFQNDHKICKDQRENQHYNSLTMTFTMVNICMLTSPLWGDGTFSWKHYCGGFTFWVIIDWLCCTSLCGQKQASKFSRCLVDQWKKIEIKCHSFMTNSHSVEDMLTWSRRMHQWGVRFVFTTRLWFTDLRSTNQLLMKEHWILIPAKVSNYHSHVHHSNCHISWQAVQGMCDAVRHLCDESWSL